MNSGCFCSPRVPAVLHFFRGCLSLSCLVRSLSNLFSTPTFSKTQFDFRVASRLLSGFDLCIVSPSPRSVVEDVSLLSFSVPLKTHWNDPPVPGAGWRDRAEHRGLRAGLLRFMCAQGKIPASAVCGERKGGQICLTSFGVTLELSKHRLSSLRKKWDGVAQRYKGQEMGRTLAPVMTPPTPPAASGFFFF